MISEYIKDNKQLKTFEMLWFNDVLETFKANSYDVRYTNNNFLATKHNDITTQFKVKTVSNSVLVTIPFSNHTEYTTEFTDYWKATEFIMYHLKQQLNQV